MDAGHRRAPHPVPPLKGEGTLAASLRRPMRCAGGPIAPLPPEGRGRGQGSRGKHRCAPDLVLRQAQDEVLTPIITPALALVRLSSLEGAAGNT